MEVERGREKKKEQQWGLVRDRRGGGSGER